MVELLLENYHRQLVLVEHDVAAMKQELESMQAREIDDLVGGGGVIPVLNGRDMVSFIASGRLDREAKS